MCPFLSSIVNYSEPDPIRLVDFRYSLGYGSVDYSELICVVIGLAYLFVGGASVDVFVVWIGGDLVVWVVLSHYVDECAGAVSCYPFQDWFAAAFYVSGHDEVPDYHVAVSLR